MLTSSIQNHPIFDEDYELEDMDIEEVMGYLLDTECEFKFNDDMIDLLDELGIDTIGVLHLDKKIRCMSFQLTHEKATEVSDYMKEYGASVQAESINDDISIVFVRND